MCLDYFYICNTHINTIVAIDDFDYINKSCSINVEKKIDTAYNMTFFNCFERELESTYFGF